MSVTFLSWTAVFFPHWKENLTKQKHKNTGALFAVLAWTYMALFDLLCCGLLLIWLAYALGNEA